MMSSNLADIAAQEKESASGTRRRKLEAEKTDKSEVRFYGYYFFRLG